WVREAVERQLRDDDQMCLREVVDELMHITGGWPLLLSEVTRKANKAEDPRTAAREVGQQLNSGAELAVHFIEQAGLHLPEPKLLAQVFAELGDEQFDTELLGHV